MVAAPADWSLHNLSADLDSAAAVKAFFHSDAPVEFYQDCYYAATGIDMPHKGTESAEITATSADRRC